jgi:DMSO/TMAO reductase YedYZ molybdopterin-dependent catalytic subunit
MYERASKLLDTKSSWNINIGGLIETPVILGFDRLMSMVKPQGLHLMECSGNTRATRLSLLSVADWAGVPFRRC